MSDYGLVPFRDATAVLVEGVSDVAAIETLAARLGLGLAARHVAVIPMGGATNVRKFLEAFGSTGLGMRAIGLCDAAEERHFARAFDGTGFAFFVCVEDLEDEFIRALGVDRVQQLLEAEGDLPTFRRFQAQPAQRDRPLERQLRRFFGTTSGRKEHYGRVLAAGLALPDIPTPLAALVDAIG